MAEPISPQHWGGANPLAAKQGGAGDGCRPCVSGIARLRPNEMAQPNHKIVRLRHVVWCLRRMPGVNAGQEGNYSTYLLSS
ncbi:MAG: hypothetical protein IPM61_16315 [Chlorobi bacterium]|nr:hypothetical protein [Chlorobiota bacterium]